MSIGKNKKARVDVKRGDFDRLISIKRITGQVGNDYNEPTGGTTETYAERFAQKINNLGSEEMRANKETAVTLATWKFDYVDGLDATMWIEDECGKIYDIINIHDDIRYVIHSVPCRLRQ